MCVVSNISSDFEKNWPHHPNNPWKDKFPIPYIPEPSTIRDELERMINEKPVTRKEFEALKKEMEELKKLLEAAKKYDAATGQPDCEMGSKVELIKQIAKLVGVDMNDVFDTSPAFSGYEDV